MRIRSPIRLLFVAVAAASLLGAVSSPAALGRPAKQSLTREGYRQHCLLCHKVPPYGIAPDIVEGLGTGNGLSPDELMPNTKCWRRCTKCWPARPAAKTRKS